GVPIKITSHSVWTITRLVHRSSGLRVENLHGKAKGSPASASTALWITQSTHTPAAATPRPIAIFIEARRYAVWHAGSATSACRARIANSPGSRAVYPRTSSTNPERPREWQRRDHRRKRGHARTQPLRLNRPATGRKA